jgi:60 kDa SS-A/Ro ribonucleoprotein
VADALEAIRTRGAQTPQREQADPRQVPNSAGGWGFTVSGQARVHRFLTLGTESGTFYAKAPELTRENAAVVMDWAKNRTAELVQHIYEVSVAGRAPRNDQAIFALILALSLGDDAGKRAAEAAFPAVVRTGEHLQHAAKYMEQFRGWGPVARRAFSGWYQGKEPDALAYQLVKYRQRHDWTHADILRSAHPKPLDSEHDMLYAWLAYRGTGYDTGTLPAMIQAYELARDIEREDAAPPANSRTGARLDKTPAYTQLLRDHPGLPWEALPDEARTLPGVWGQLLDNGMPMGALIRQLPTLTNAGLFPRMGGGYTQLVCDQLRDPARLIKARVHPIRILLAARTYAAGVSANGKEHWPPDTRIIDAMSDAFYAAFPAAEPSGKRVMVSVDISGSMASHPAGGFNTSCKETATAMALVTAATEPRHLLTAFTNGGYPSYWSGINGMGSGITELPISPRQRLDDAIRTAERLPMGGTNCAVPMLWALENKIEVDTFEIHTDNETWYGDIHPHQALEQYRQRMGIDARLAVVAYTPTDFTIADIDDPRSLDVSGFDSAVPGLLADFSRGDI